MTHLPLVTYWARAALGALVCEDVAVASAATTALPARVTMGALVDKDTETASAAVSAAPSVLPAAADAPAASITAAATVAAAVAVFEEALAVLITCVAALSANLLASYTALGVARACRSEVVLSSGSAGRSSMIRR